MNGENESLDAITSLLSSLTNPDSLKIFRMCERGIHGSTESIKELGLTQKRYYTWLHRLVDVGLVEKSGKGVYRQTLLGKMCYEWGKQLADALSHGGKLELADKMMKSSSLSMREKEGVLHAISGANLFPTLNNVQMIDSYDRCMDEVVGLLDGAEKTAYLATSKRDFRVVDSLINIIDRGATIFALSSEMETSDSIEIVKMLLNPSSIKVIRKWITSKKFNIRVTKNLPYCFVVVDGEEGIIEISINPNLYVAFKFKNALLCQKLIDAFMFLYEEGKDDPRFKFAKKTLGLFK